jgi:hypothetical protein
VKRSECLERARQAVCVGREVAHGNPKHTFGRIARLWQAYLVNKWPVLQEMEQCAELTKTDAALMQDLVKTARLQGNPSHADSWIDKSGYAACGCEIGTADAPSLPRSVAGLGSSIGAQARLAECGLDGQSRGQAIGDLASYEWKEIHPAIGQ